MRCQIQSIRLETWKIEDRGKRRKQIQISRDSPFPPFFTQLRGDFEMPNTTYAGQTPIPNTAANQHMPFAQKAFSDEGAFRNLNEWELPAGAQMTELQDQATIYLPDDFPTPLRVQLRIISVSESGRRKSSVEGMQYSFSCEGRLLFKSENHSVKDHEMYATVFYRTAAR